MTTKTCDGLTLELTFLGMRINYPLSPELKGLSGLTNEYGGPKSSSFFLKIKKECLWKVLKQKNMQKYFVNFCKGIR